MSRYKFFGGKAVGAIQIKDYANLVDNEVIVIGDKTYQWNDTEGDIDEGNVWLDRGAGITTNALAAAEVIAKINANKPTVPVTAVIDPKDTATVHIYADGRGAAGNLEFTTDMSDSGNTIAAESDLLADGENGGNEILHRGNYTVTAIDVLADNIMIETSLPGTPTHVFVEVRGSTGIPKYHTAKVTVSGTKIRLNFDGATDPAADDVVTWMAIG